MKFTVIFTMPPSDAWQGFNCTAHNSDAAEAQAMTAHPGCAVLWVNTGFDNMSME